VPLAAGWERFPIWSLEYKEYRAMTAEQVQALLEFVNPALRGYDLDMTLQVKFAVHREGEEEYTHLDIADLGMYLQEQYGVTECQADVIEWTLGKAFDPVLDMVRETFEGALQDGVTDALDLGAHGK
jgi:hypothetical protein